VSELVRGVSWNEITFPCEARWARTGVLVRFSEKDGNRLVGTVIETQGGYSTGYTCDHWNTEVRNWWFAEYMEYKYDPNQCGDTEEDI